METLYIPNENDFKRWVKEAVKEFLETSTKGEKFTEQCENELLSRNDIAQFLRISLVTLTDWVKRGLPSHKQRGRVYFDKTEVKEYIKRNKMNQLKFSDRFQNLRQELA
jgi:hypothetical protein